MQKIFYEKEIDLLHQLKELVSLTVDESIDYKIEDHGVRAVGSLAIKGEYISQEKRHFLENVELDVYADDQKIIDRQDFHLKVEDFHYDIIDGNLKIKIEVGVYGVEEGENRYIQLDEDPIDEIEKLPSSIAKMLAKALSDKKTHRNGESLERSIDVRIIAASDANLRRLTEKGQFDEKLFNIISRSIIRVPSLRSRRDDIPMLAINIIEELSKQHQMEPKVL